MGVPKLSVTLDSIPEVEVVAALADTVKANRLHIKKLSERDKELTDELFKLSTELDGVFKFVECKRSAKVDYKAVLVTLADKYGIRAADIEAAVKMFSTPQDSYIQLKFI